jgi:uncharacterized protein YqjF (DUF2071 family)
MSCALPQARAESEGVRREPIDSVDRLAIRTRPPGLPIMHQHWGSLLFMHWPVPVDLLRPLIPAPLVVDTHDGLAWVGITPFTMWGVRPAFTPPLPFLSESPRLNVRTYVTSTVCRGLVLFPGREQRGRSSRCAACLHLPYFRARMSLEHRDRTIYSLLGAPPPRGPCRGVRRVRSRLVGRRKVASVRAGFSEFFLIERYCLYSAAVAGSTGYGSCIDPGPCTRRACRRTVRR